MAHIGTRQIETERLILRRFALEDVDDAFCGWFSNPDVAMYMRWDAHSDIHRRMSFYLASWLTMKSRTSTDGRLR